MIKVDEDALICDLAETYQIYDYKQLPLKTIAVFSVGLSNNSRIKLKLNNQSIPIDTLLLAGISDKLSILLWRSTKDGQKGKNQPNSIVETLLNVGPKEKDVIGFNSIEDFVNKRNELLKNIKKGGSINGD